MLRPIFWNSFAGKYLSGENLMGIFFYPKWGYITSFLILHNIFGEINMDTLEK